MHKTLYGAVVMDIVLVLLYIAVSQQALLQILWKNSTSDSESERSKKNGKNYTNNVEFHIMLKFNYQD